MNTDRILNVLSAQLSVLKASMDGKSLNAFDFEDDEDIGFDHDVVLDTPRAVIDDIAESTDVSQIYLTGIVDSLKRLKAMRTSHSQRRKMLATLARHRQEVASHLESLDKLIAKLSEKQAVNNVVYLKGDRRET